MESNSAPEVESSTREKENDISTVQSLKLKKKAGQPLALSKSNVVPKIVRSQPIRALSPRDNTPIIINGEELSRENIPVIKLNPENIRSLSPRVAENISPLSPIKKEVITVQSPHFFKPKAVLKPKTIDDVVAFSETDETEIEPSPPPVMKTPMTPQIKKSERSKIKEVLKNIDEKSNPLQNKKSPISRESKPPEDIQSDKTSKVSKKQKNKPKFLDFSLEQIEKTKTEFRVKFNILRENYPSLDIPSFNDTETLDLIDAKYQEYIKHIHISASGDAYQQYLILAFLGIEFLGIKVLGLDFGGFTMNQLTFMSKYKRLLIELGEKNYNVATPSWSAETKLCMMIVFNAVIFVVVKMFENKFGPGVSSMIQNIINNTMSGVSSVPAQSAPQKGVPFIPEVPAPPQQGGFDLGSLIGTFGKMFSSGAPAAKNEKASRKPKFDD